MSNVIKFNGVGIPAKCYLNKQGSDRKNTVSLQAVKPARSDGEVVINYDRDPKFMDVEVLVNGDTLADTQALIDTLKKITDLHGEPLWINYAGGYRLFYVHSKGSDTSLINDNEYIPSRIFTAHFEVADPPFGLDCDVDGNLLVEYALNLANQTLDAKSNPVQFFGSVTPKPKIQITFGQVGDMNSFDVTNKKNGQQMTITPTSPVNGDTFVIDTDAKTVQRNGIDIDFSGIWPEFDLSETGNTVDVNVYSSTGAVLGASNTTNNTKRTFYGSRKEAQSFTISTSDTLQRVNLLLSKIGNGAGAITLRIETNSAGSPSGTLVDAAATVTVDSSAISGVPAWFQSIFPFIGLTSSTTYWLVLSTTGGDVNNCWQWHMSSTDTYANGSAKENAGSWVSLTGDFCFKVYKVAVDINNSQIDYDSATLNLNSTSQRDAGNTTALWAGDGIITMNGVTGIDQQQTTTTSGVSSLGSVNNGYSAYKGLGQPFTPSTNRMYQSISAYVGANSSGGSAAGWKVWIEIQTDNAGSPSGTVLATSQQLTSDASSTWQNGDWQDFVFSNPVSLTGSVQYWAVLKTNLVGNNSDNTIFWKGLTTTTQANAKAKVNDFATSSWSIQNRSTIPDSWFQDFAFKANYVDYSATEYGVTNELDSTTADIIAVSQYVNTILLGGASFQGQFSPDNGSTWNNLPRDTSLMLTDTKPSTSGNQLKWRAALSSTDSSKPYVTELQVGWRKGIIINATSTYAAQSFQVPANGNRQRLDLYLAKMGTPGDITVRIETNNAGKPSGTLVNANATKTLTAADVQSSFGWVSFNFPASFSLSTGTTYWIVIRSAATANNSNKYLVMANNNRLSTGTSSKSTDSGANWTNTSTSEDLMFKTYATSGNAFNYDLLVPYYIRSL